MKGSKNSKFRQVISRGTKDGLSFEVIPREQVPAILPALKQVSDIWLLEKNSAEKGFSLGYFDEDYLQYFDCAVVKYDGDIVAFANLWQSGSHHELSIDLMRYKEVINPDGKDIKNMMEYLFINLFMWGKAAGFHYFSLGMAPFTGLDNANETEANMDNTVDKQSSIEASSVIKDEDESEGEIEDHDTIGPKWRYVTSMVTKHGKSYYNFSGLRKFKEKFNPNWEPRYIGIETGLRAGIKPIKGLTDTTLLISGGLSNLTNLPAKLPTKLSAKTPTNPLIKR